MRKNEEKNIWYKQATIKKIPFRVEQFISSVWVCVLDLFMRFRCAYSIFFLRRWRELHRFSYVQRRYGDYNYVIFTSMAHTVRPAKWKIFVVFFLYLFSLHLHKKIYMGFCNLLKCDQIVDLAVCLRGQRWKTKAIPSPSLSYETIYHKASATLKRQTTTRTNDKEKMYLHLAKNNYRLFWTYGWNWCGNAIDMQFERWKNGPFSHFDI